MESQRLALRRAQGIALSGEAAELSRFLAALDALSGMDSSSIRFAVAASSMARGQYECAAAAWCDAGGPGCWNRANDDADTVDSATAAAAMGGACLELVRLRERVSELEQALESVCSTGDSAGDSLGDSLGATSGDSISTIVSALSAAMGAARV
jgi:hypothetical protein